MTDVKYDVKGAAAYLGLSVSTLNKLRTKGGGPEFLKLCDRVLYEKDQLDKWVETRRRVSTADHYAREARRF
jgi:hypothetical protein